MEDVDLSVLRFSMFQKFVTCFSIHYTVRARQHWKVIVSCVALLPNQSFREQRNISKKFQPVGDLDDQLLRRVTRYFTISHFACHGMTCSATVGIVHNRKTATGKGPQDVSLSLV